MKLRNGTPRMNKYEIDAECNLKDRYNLHLPSLSEKYTDRRDLLLEFYSYNFTPKVKNQPLLHLLEELPIMI
jgi:hypothetical protein